nr:MAG: RNA-dependent RNA polymerase [Mitovirus sp.]
MSLKSMSAAIVNRRWASPGEIWGITHLLILSVGLTEYMSAFKQFTERLLTLWRKSGKKFLVLYMKEALAHVIAFLNHKKRSLTKGAPSLHLSRAGLPTIVPGLLRAVILRFRREGGLKDRLVVRTVLTVLSMYRVLNFVSKPNLATITDPFNGISPLLDINELGRVLALFPRMIIKGVSWSISESAGPNGPRATWFAGSDAIAFLENPRQWIFLLGFIVINRQFLALAWLLIIQLISFPGMVVLVAIKGLKVIPFKLGRLSALNKDGAGKRRIIAITDFWTQLVFKPLHLAIFSMLKKIEQDGTFDQFKPVEQWVLPRVRLGFPAFSFDLSAATDRLPIALQQQILTILFGKWFAKCWAGLLDRDWWFQGTPVRYAVGQPMGALSSWAMLAFSHHVIVQLAALRAGWTTWFPHYALLGDDLVIADEAVAGHYQVLMRHLGVPINLSKSIISETGMVEFAKRWVSGTRGELSAVGPGLLLAVLRNLYLYPVLVLHLFERSWIAFPKQVENAIASLKKVRRNVTPTFMMLLYVTIVGPSGLMRDGRHVTAFADSWFESVTRLPMSSAVSYLILAFKAMVEKDMANKTRTAEENLQYFAQNWAKMPILLGDWVTGVFSIPLVLISPGFWIYLVTMWKGRNPSFSFSLNLHGIVNPAAAMTPGAIQFDLLDLADLASIEWTDRPAVKAQLGLSVDLMKEVEILISADLQANPCLDLSTDVIIPKPDPVWDWLDDPATKTPLWEALVGKNLHKIAVGSTV